MTDHTPPHSSPHTVDTREAAARIIYDAFPFDGGAAEKPPWLPNGNSRMQDRARDAATAVLALRRPAQQPASPDTAPLLTRLHDFVETESKRWRNFATGEITFIEVSPAGKLVQEAIEALARPAQTPLRDALWRVLQDIDFMVEGGVIPDIRDDIIYQEARSALTSTVPNASENKEGGAS